MEKESQIYKFSILGKIKSFNFNKNTNQINYRKMQHGITPNLIHSMDAANISLLVNSIINIYNEKINLVTIHDCFCTDANHVEMIEYQIRLSFLNLYKNQDFIENFHNFTISYLKHIGIKITDDNSKIILSNDETIDIPIKPNFNDNNSLNLEDNIMNSQYFIN
jgi:Mitochondrial DNA-directed RNA polymerase